MAMNVNESSAHRAISMSLLRLLLTNNLQISDRRQHRRRVHLTHVRAYRQENGYGGVHLRAKQITHRDPLHGHHVCANNTSPTPVAQGETNGESGLALHAPSYYLCHAYSSVAKDHSILQSQQSVLIFVEPSDLHGSRALPFRLCGAPSG